MEIIRNRKTQNKNNYFWENNKILFIVLMLFIAFAVFYFSTLGAYTDQNFGEKLNATRKDWFLITADVICGILFLTPFFLLLYKRIVNHSVEQRDWRIFVLGYFAIFTFTLLIFALQTIAMIAFFNSYYRFSIDFKLNIPDVPHLGPTHGVTVDNYQVEFLNRLATDYAFGILWLTITITIYFTIFYLRLHFKNKENSKLEHYYRDFKNTTMKIAGFSFFCLMTAAFGLGVFGINLNNTDGISENFKYDGKETTIGGLLNADKYKWFTNGILEKLEKNNADAVANHFLDKGDAWGVNNNWSGMLIFLLTVILAVYIIIDFTKNTVMIAKNKKIYDLDSKNYTFNAFLVFFLVILSIYVLDRYIIVNIADGNLNPNLFNNGMVKLAEGDYHGTIYYWIIFFFLPIASFSALFAMNQPIVEKVNYFFNKQIFSKFKQTRKKDK